MEKVEIEGYQTDTWNSMACDFIRDAARGDEPFTLFLSYSPPHDPWAPGNVPEGYYEKFTDTEFPHPANFRDAPDQYADRMKSAEDHASWLEDAEDWRRCYYAMVNHLDDKLGELMDALEESGCAEDTVVVYTSDHGEMFGSQGRIQKLTFYDEACRVPFLLRWPGQIEAGSVSEACLNTPDIAPTLAGLLGIEVPREAEGRDLSQLALGNGGPEPEFSFMQGIGHTYLWEDGSEWRAVRDKRYTYARYLCDGSEHLYDNIEDPYQNVNLAMKEDCKEVTAGMREQMQRRMDELNDEFMPFSEYQKWMDPEDRYSCIASARGGFEGPYAPIKSLRGKKESRQD
jgi:arylsulfatase A-like enzyme